VLLDEQPTVEHDLTVTDLDYLTNVVERVAEPDLATSSHRRHRGTVPQNEVDPRALDLATVLGDRKPVM
jgi:hypothetical protein